jgi:thiamine biosynthesis lipoprotein
MIQDAFSFRAMNTRVEFQIRYGSEGDPVSKGEAEVASIRQAVVAIFEQVERICSRFLPDSELSVINRSLCQPISVSGLLFQILHHAERAYLKTGGVFNPAIYQRLHEVGYRYSMADKEGWKHTLFALQTEPPSEDLIPITAFPYTLDHQKRTVTRKEGMGIDLGGIAKGWTVDQAATFLASHGYGFVSAGGDIRLFGQHKIPVSIALENPVDPSQDVGTLFLEQGAVATSSVAKRKWKAGNRWFHHLIDPRTGQPVSNGILSCTVSASTAMEADVWAKTLLILGPKRGIESMKKHRLQAFWIDQDGKVRSVS